MWGRILGGLLLVGLIAGGIWWFSAQSEPQTRASSPGIPDDAFEMIVESVHDGDTLRARVIEPNDIMSDTASTRVRLIGLDTPEISPEVQCWGAEATTSLERMLPPGSTLWAASDREMLDRYDRHLLYLWTSEGLFVNAELLARGDAAALSIAPNTAHAALFEALEDEAAAAARGRWGAC